LPTRWAGARRADQFVFSFLGNACSGAPTNGELLAATHGVLVTPATLWRRWSGEPWVVAPWAISLGLYCAGWLRMRRRLGPRRAPRWQAVSFFAGCASIFVALISPLAALSDTLFSAHMAEHEILMMVAAPLFACSRPLLPFL
jgi:putative membrane protein